MVVVATTAISPEYTHVTRDKLTNDLSNSNDVPGNVCTGRLELARLRRHRNSRAFRGCKHRRDRSVQHATDDVFHTSQCQRKRRV
jgi:hypothetical protein